MRFFGCPNRLEFYDDEGRVIVTVTPKDIPLLIWHASRVLVGRF